MTLAPGQLAALRADAPVTTAATAVLDGRTVLVGTTGTGVRAWDLADARPVGQPIPVEAGAVATGVVDGGAVVVSRGADGLARVHRLADGSTLGPPVGVAEPPRTGGFAMLPRPLATGRVGGRPVVAATRHTSAERYAPQVVEVRELPSGQPVGRPIMPGDGQAFEVQAVPDGDTTVLVTRNADRTLGAYDAATGDPYGHPDVDARATSIGLLERDGGPLLVVGCVDNTVRAFDLRTGAAVGPVRSGHTGAVSRVAAVRSAGRTLLVTAATGISPTETRFWDLDTGAPVGPVLAGHPIADGLLVAAEVDGRAVLVTAAEDGAAVWDVETLVGAAPAGGAR